MKHSFGMKRLILVFALCGLLLPSAYGETISFKEGTYVGDVAGGVPHGHGTYTSSDGYKYVGQYMNGMEHGYGTATENDWKYVGELQNDMQHGLGTEIRPNGKYVGEFKNGRSNGQGTYTFDNGDKFVGDSKDGQPWEGTQYDKDGNVVGTISRGMASSSSSSSSVTFDNGAKYVGGLKNGEPHGQGTMTWVNGDKYVGDFKDRRIHGQGTFTWANGDKYVGEFRDYKMNGLGTYTNSDGDRYVGEFQDNKWHGDGVLYPATIGNRLVGEWRNGDAWNAVVISASGEFMGNIVNGAPQQQQQSQNQGFTKSQLMELLLLVNLLKRDNNASQKAIDWERIFGGGGFTCKTDHYFSSSGRYGDSTTRCR